MAKTIEELNFQLKVDDKAFKAQMEADKKAAKDLADTVRNYLNIKKAQGTLSAKEYQTLKRLDNLESNRRINAEKELTAYTKRLAAEERLAKVKEKNNQHQSTHNRLLGEAASLAASYVSIWGAKKLIENIVQTTGEFELQRTTLAAMLQDAEKATQIFEQLKTFSVSSPFSFKELATYAKQLTAYSVPINDLFNTTKMLADVSAGLGVGMDRLVLAYGQVRSAEFLRGQEVRQFTESGIPILEELRKQFVALGEEGITVADVFDKISRRLVPFEMVDKVFKDLTSEGGKFYQMQEIQSETLKGKISNLKDAYMIMFNEIGSRQSGLLKGGVDALRGLAENYEKIGRLLVGLVSAYGTYRTAMLITEVATKSFALSNHKLINSFVSLGKFIKTNPYVALATAIAALVGYLITAGEQSARFREELVGIANVRFTEAEKSVKTFKELAERLKDSTEGSQAYRDAIADINRQYGDYLPNLLTEKNALQEILAVENEVTNAIYARAKAYATEEGRRKIEERYGKDIQDYGSYVTSVVSGKYGESAAQDFIKGYRKRLEEDTHSDWFNILRETLDNYFGKGASGKIINTERFVTARRFIGEYAKAVRNLTKENANFDRKIDARFGVQGYSTNLEREISEPIVAAYNKALQELRNKKLPIEEFNEAANNLKLGELYQLKKAFEDLDEEAKKAGKEGSWANKIKEIQEQINALQPRDLAWLQKIVNPLVTGKGNNDLKARIDTKYEEYLDNLRKEYKAATEAYDDSQKTLAKLTADKQKGIAVDEDVLRKATEQNEVYKQRRQLIIDIATAFGIADTLENKKRGGTTGKSQEQKDLETRIDLLKKLQDAYEKLSEYIDDDKMPEILKNLFSASPVPDEVLRNLDFMQQLKQEAAKLAKYDKEASERLLTSLAQDPTQALVTSARAYEKYRKELQELLAKDFGLEGEGIGFDISKIIADLTTANESARVSIDRLKKDIDKQEDYIKAKVGGSEKEQEDYWQNYKTAAYAALDDIFSKEKDYNKKIAQEKINDLSNKAYKDVLINGGLNPKDLSDWGDKSISQVREIIGKLKNILTSDNILSGASDEIKAKAEEAGLSLETLAELLKKMVGLDLATSTDEKLKKTLKTAKDISSEVSNLGGLFSKLGEAIDNEMLVSLGESLDVISSISDAILDCEDLMKAVNKSLDGATDAFDDLLSSSDLWTMLVKVVLIIGEQIVNFFAKSAEEEREAAEAAREYRDALRDIKAETDSIFGESQWHRVISRLEDFKEVYSGVVDMLATPIVPGLSLPQDPFEIYGGMDEFLAKYNAGQLPNNFDELAKTLMEFRDSVSDIFSGLADDIVGNMVTAFEKTGDSVSDLENAFASMGDTLVRSIVKSYLMEQVFDKYKNQVFAVIDNFARSRKDEGAIENGLLEIKNMFDGMREDIESLAPFFDEIFSLGREYFNAFTDESAQNLADGIKGITEDTANLLASYVNAIRADVSYSKVQRDNILTEVKNIASYVASPTLMDYLNRIQANTYDNARATESILSDIRSMMTTDGGFTALRVYS